MSRKRLMIRLGARILFLASALIACIIAMQKLGGEFNMGLEEYDANTDDTTGRARMVDPGPLPKLGQAPSFMLEAQNGTTITDETMKGTIWVANFMFTRCQGPCPLMSQKIKNLNTTFQHVSQVKFVSITTDPEHDSSAVLAEYAQKYEADSNRWFFLRGGLEQTRELAQEGLKVSVGDTPDMHSTRFILIDPDLSIRGYFDSRDSEELAKLKVSIEKLMQKYGSLSLKNY